MIKSINNAAHYVWGNSCDGWPLIESKDLSIKEEQMPAGTSEQWHYHEKAQQFFYILSGEAVVEIGEKEFVMHEKEGVNIEPGQNHRILNKSHKPIRFLVISQPSTKEDRINIE